jgi:hypothetical protein
MGDNSRSLWVTFAALGAAFIALLGPQDAHAAVAYYSDLPSFQAATASLQTQTETFDATGLQPFTHVTSTDGSIGPAGGVFTGSVWNDVVSRSLGESTTFSYGSSSMNAAGGFWDMTPGNFAQGLTINMFITPGSPGFPFGGQFQVNQISQMSGEFFGWTSNVPFNFFTITAGPFAGGLESFDLDNLTFATVPEPAAMPLLFIAATACMRRSRRARQSGKALLRRRPR